jgi:hypothetical protein
MTYIQPDEETRKKTGGVFMKIRLKAGHIRCGVMSLIIWTIVLTIVFLLGMNLLWAQKKQYEETYLLLPESVQDILRRDRHYDMLEAVSPDRDHFLIPVQPYFSTLELMDQKTYRLAMLEFCPHTNREWRLSTYGIKGLKIYSLSMRKFLDVDLPEGILVSDMMWSPEGKKIAFLAHLREDSRVWTADVSSGKAEPLSEANVMATLAGRPQRRSPPISSSRMLQWTPDGSVLTLLVPEDRGPEPQKEAIPKSPIIRRTREKPTPTRTYPFLLRTPRDKELFRYYTTAQLALLTPGEPPRKIGEPAMYMNISLSPDGKYILAEKMTMPFSYIVGYNDFPRELQVMDMEGKILTTIRKVPLDEAMRRAGDRGAEEDLPRDVSWRPDGKGLSFLWREEKKEEEAGEEADDQERKDRLMFLAPPFDMSQVKTLVADEKRFNDVSYSHEGHYAFASLTEREEKKRRQEIVAYDLTRKKPKAFVLVKDVDPEDVLNLPGEIITRSTGNGVVYALLSSNRKSVYLQGAGYKDDFKPQPFIDKIVILSGEKKRIFEGSKDMFERRDGLLIQGRINLPIYYKEGSRVPAVFWAYPREYQSFEEYKKAAIRSRNRNAFPHLSYRNASEIWLTQGYAVVEPDIPSSGKGKVTTIITLPTSSIPCTQLSGRLTRWGMWTLTALEWAATAMEPS